MIATTILRITESPTALGTITVLLLVFLLAPIFKPQQRAKVPFLDVVPTGSGQSKPKDDKTLLGEGYERVRYISLSQQK